MKSKIVSHTFIESVVLILITGVVTVLGNKFVQQDILERQLEYEYRLEEVKDAKEVMRMLLDLAGSRVFCMQQIAWAIESKNYQRAKQIFNGEYQHIKDRWNCKLPFIIAGLRIFWGEKAVFSIVDEKKGGGFNRCLHRDFIVAHNLIRGILSKKRVDRDSLIELRDSIKQLYKDLSFVYQTLADSYAMKYKFDEV